MSGLALPLQDLSSRAFVIERSSLLRPGTLVREAGAQCTFSLALPDNVSSVEVAQLAPLPHERASPGQVQNPGLREV
jgi:hypothetical protein